MSEFPFPRVEPLVGNRYRLVEDYLYAWSKDGIEHRLTVPAGFTSDLASVPRLLWWYISPFDLGPSVVPHDWIYRHAGALPAGSHLMCEASQWIEVTAAWERKEADRLFGRMMRETSVPRFKRRQAYRAVRLFGGWVWRRRARRAWRV
jgi:hypothetical protein